MDKTYATERDFEGDMNRVGSKRIETVGRFQLVMWRCGALTSVSGRGTQSNDARR